MAEFETTMEWWRNIELNKKIEMCKNNYPNKLSVACFDYEEIKLLHDKHKDTIN